MQCLLGRLAVLNPGLEGPVEVMIRPEQIHLTRHEGAGGTNGANGAGITAEVIDHVYYGPDTVVRLSIEGSAQTIVKARTFDQDVPGVGEVVGLAVLGPVVVFPGAGAAMSGEQAKRCWWWRLLLVALAGARGRMREARREAARSCCTTGSIRR